MALDFEGVNLSALRSCAGGVSGLRDSVRGRGCAMGALTGTIGDAGTAGRMPSGGGR